MLVINVLIRRAFIDLSSLFVRTASYCSPTIVAKAASGLLTALPHTTLSARSVVEPQTTLKPLMVLLPQTTDDPQSTEAPDTLDPHTTEDPHTTDDPQTTEPAATVDVPLTRVTVFVLEL